MLPRPISPYGATKLAAENYVRIFGELYGLEAVILRCFNVYGPRQGAGSSYGGVITAFLSRLWNDQAPVIHGDGKQTRDFVNVGDVVSANVLALESKNAVGEVFNVASGRATMISDLAEILQRITNKEHLKLIFTEPRIGDIKHCLADISKAERLLGFHPKVKISDGLLRLVQ
jgi:UDP-glucose 4-epimerase